jgi:hypothetical protein
VHRPRRCLGSITTKNNDSVREAAGHDREFEIESSCSLRRRCVLYCVDRRHRAEPAFDVSSVVLRPLRIAGSTFTGDAPTVTRCTILLVPHKTGGRTASVPVGVTYTYVRTARGRMNARARPTRHASSARADLRRRPRIFRRRVASHSHHATGACCCSGVGVDRTGVASRGTRRVRGKRGGKRRGRVGTMPFELVMIRWSTRVRAGRGRELELDHRPSVPRLRLRLQWRGTDWWCSAGGGGWSPSPRRGVAANARKSLGFGRR